MMRLRFAPMNAALAMALLMGPSVMGPSAQAAGPDRVVILPIVVHSADPDAAYVSRGISDMISSRLEQTGRVRVDRVEEPAAATTSIATALQEGRARQGDFAIYGSFTQFGEGASLDIHCIPLAVPDETQAENARRIFIQSGTVGEIIPKIDAIVDRIGDCLNGGGVQAARPTEPGTATGAASPPPGDGASEATLRALSERLEALERAVFGQDAAAARPAEPPPPES